jgi:glycosyltransferase involved in cell wall biosynthesis
LSPEALASSIQRVLDNPVAAAAMGERGRRMAETKYSWRTIATQLLRLYEGVRAPSVGDTVVMSGRSGLHNGDR